MLRSQTTYNGKGFNDNWVQSSVDTVTFSSTLCHQLQHSASLLLLCHSPSFSFFLSFSLSLILLLSLLLSLSFIFLVPFPPRSLCSLNLIWFCYTPPFSHPLIFHFSPPSRFLSFFLPLTFFVCNPQAHPSHDLMKYFLKMQNIVFFTAYWGQFYVLIYSLVRVGAELPVLLHMTFIFK